MDELRRLRELLAAATPGEWKCHDGPDDYEHRIAVELSAYAEDPVCDVFLTSDAALIAAAVNALPKLLAIAEAYYAAPIGRLEDVVNRIHYIHFDDEDEQAKVAPMAAASETVRLVRVVGEETK